MVAPTTSLTLNLTLILSLDRYFWVALIAKSAESALMEHTNYCCLWYIPSTYQVRPHLNPDE